MWLACRQRNERHDRKEARDEHERGWQSQTAGPGHAAATARAAAEGQIWVPVHLGLIVAFILMLGGLVAIQESITGGLPGALPRFGLAAAIGPFQAVDSINFSLLSPLNLVFAGFTSFSTASRAP